jgi:hypothetical protein
MIYYDIIKIPFLDLKYTSKIDFLKHLFEECTVNNLFNEPNTTF